MQRIQVCTNRILPGPPTLHTLDCGYLDDKQWDQWLALYAQDVTFWMPSWDGDDELTQDPQTEISLIWYGSREGLEDRMFRIKTERSSASIPGTRTSHNLSNIEIIEHGEGICQVRFN